MNMEYYHCRLATCDIQTCDHTDFRTSFITQLTDSSFSSAWKYSWRNSLTMTRHCSASKAKVLFAMERIIKGPRRMIIVSKYHITKDTKSTNDLQFQLLLFLSFDRLILFFPQFVWQIILKKLNDSTECSCFDSWYLNRIYRIETFADYEIWQHRLIYVKGKGEM